MRDAYNGPEPYERLQLIYTEREGWEYVVRVCQAATEAVLDEEAQRFAEWAEIYREKQAK